MAIKGDRPADIGGYIGVVVAYLVQDGVDSTATLVGL
jgi:hypothetical protein